MRIWRHVSPHLPQPQNGRDALTILHTARTAAESMPKAMRYYSHRWLLDWGLESQLPDYMRPSAERMYPEHTKAVGVSVNTSMEEFRPAAEFIQGAINYAILDAFEDKKTDSATVTKRMLEAKNKAKKQIFGQFIRPDIMPMKVEILPKEN